MVNASQSVILSEELEISRNEVHTEDVFTESNSLNIASLGTISFNIHIL